MIDEATIKEIRKRRNEWFAGFRMNRFTVHDVDELLQALAERDKELRRLVLMIEELTGTIGKLQGVETENIVQKIRIKELEAVRPRQDPTQLEPTYAEQGDKP